MGVPRNGKAEDLVDLDLKPCLLGVEIIDACFFACECAHVLVPVPARMNS